MLSLPDPERRQDLHWPGPEDTSPAWLRQHLGLRTEAALPGWEVRAEGRLLWDGQAWSVSPGETWLQADLERAWFVRAGWLPPQAGLGRALDLGGGPVPRDPTQFLAWGGEEPGHNPPALEARAVWESLSLELRWLPWVTPLALPDPQGVWFSRRAIPSQFRIEALETTFTLRDLQIEARDAAPFTWNPAYTARLRYSGEFLEAELGAWAAWDPAPAYNALASLGEGTTYRLDLWPERAWLGAGHLSVAAVWGDAELWAQGRVTGGRRFVGTATAQGLSFPLSQPFLTGTALEGELNGGLAWRFAPGWEVWGELRAYARSPLEGPAGLESSTPRPPWTAALSWAPADLPLGFDLLALGTVGENSGLAAVQGRWHWLEGLTLRALWPWFWGLPDSEWGQYQGRSRAQLGLAWSL